MGKILIGILFILILGLYFFTDQTKIAIKKVTGFVVSESGERIKEAINESINNINTTSIKQEVKELIKEEK